VWAAKAFVWQGVPSWFKKGEATKFQNVKTGSSQGHEICRSAVCSDKTWHESKRGLRNRRWAATSYQVPGETGVGGGGEWGGG